MAAYTPTQEDLNRLLSMLTDSATGNNSKQVNDAMMSYANNPDFSLLLCTVFASASPCVQNPLPLDWTTYRAVAGLALKTAMANSKIAIAEPILVTSGQATTQVLSTATEAMIVRTAAQIYSRITARVGRIDWWASAVGSEMSQLLLTTLLRSDKPAQVKAALYALQYLLEDAAGPIGDASGAIIGEITSFAATQSAEVRRHCFALVCQVYELGVDADWNVDNFSPMQTGLCNSSFAVAAFATQMAQTEALGDSVLMRDVLSCFSTLMDYLEYFASGVDLASVAASWVNTAAARIVGADDDQVTTAALDFIVKIVSVFEATNGEGPIVHLYNALAPRLTEIVRALFPLMLLRAEEERSRLQTDHYSLRDANRSQSSIRKTYGDDGGGNGGDGDEDVMSVRRSASMCLDHLCRLDCEAVFPLILDVCLTKWDDADWRYREVSMLCLGAAVHGAYAQLDPYFGEFVPKLIAAIKAGTSQHVFVTSMAAWTAQRMSVWLVTTGAGYIGQYCDALLGNFVCESKRVQCSSISALRMLFMTAGAVGIDPAALQPFRSLVTESIVQCIPHYHTTNLRHLCDLAIDMLNAAPSAEAAGRLVAPFVAAFPAKFGKLGETFTAFYSSSDSSSASAATVVDTDVFDIARVIYTHYQAMADPADVFQHASSWIQMLAAVAGGAHTDDPELSEQPTRLLSMLLVSLPSTQLAAFPQTSELGQCVGWLLQHPSASVKGAACALLSDMLSGFGPQVYTFVTAQQLMGYLSPLLTPSTDLNVLIDASRTVRVMASTATDAAQLQPIITALSLCIRSDVYESTREGHCQLAFDLCAVLPATPTAAALPALTAVAELLYSGANDYDKAESTVAFCAVVVSPQGQGVIAAGSQEEIAGFVRSFFKMVFSWQKMAEGQCVQAIAAAIGALMAAHSQHVWAVFRANSEAYVRDILSHYGVNM